MSAGTDLPPRLGPSPSAGTRTPGEFAVWLERHEAAVRRGGYLGDDWGNDAYVDGVVGRFCLPHIESGAAVVLEIGPGGGRYTERLLPHARRLHAVDVSGEILDHLAARIGGDGRLLAHRGDGRSLAAVPDASVDFVFSFNLFLFLDLETVHDYCAEIRRVLRKGGVAVLQYADYSSEGGRRHFLAGRSAALGAEKPFTRFRYLTREFMERVLATEGLAPAFNAAHGRDSFAGAVRACDVEGRARHAAIHAAATLSRRTETTPAGLDAEEVAWWDEFAGDAERIAWVQPESVRRAIRGPYVRSIVAAVPRGGTVLDYGCGTGWLARLLASFGAESVVGVDESPAQIEIARREAKRSPEGKALRFLVGRGVPEGITADVAVCHAVLHHLSWCEIRAAIREIDAALVPGGTLFLLEPVAGTRSYGGWGVVPAALARLFSDRGPRRRVSDEERRLRARLLASRSGKRLPGRGPSPKETPFRPGEIETRVVPVGNGYRLVSVRPALYRAHHVAAEIALFSETRPRLGALLARPALALASAWERMSFARRPAESFEGWVFCLYRFEKTRAITAAGPGSSPA